MATTKTIQPTGETINLPEMTDRPDMSVVSTSLGKVVDAVNSDNASLIKTEEALAIISTGNTHGAINAGQYVYVRAHSTLAEGLYLASANVAANGTLSGSNVTAVSGGGLNALNSNIASLQSNVNPHKNTYGMESKEAVSSVSQNTWFDIRSVFNAFTDVDFTGMGLIYCRNNTASGIIRVFHTSGENAFATIAIESGKQYDMVIVSI